MFVEIGDDGKITPTATPITEGEVWARLRNEGAADAMIAFDRQTKRRFRRTR